MTGDHCYGGFWRRAVAFSIDMVILHFISLILFFIGVMALHTGFVSRLPRVSLTEMTESFVIPYYVAVLLINMSYFTYFHGIAGQTPGKMLLGLMVVQTTEEKMTPGIAFLRWVGYIISGLFLYLGFIWAAFDGKKQGWHDKIAGTMVIHIRKERGEQLSPRDLKNS
jgi:uncharacterized RDD family membrane protein YckC